MMRHPTRYLLLALGSIFALPAFGQQTPAPSPAVSANASPADKALTEANDRMNQGMEGPMSGDADQDFTAMMLAHHEGAVAMAKAELQYGKDPAMRGMAAKIIASQTKEITEMQKWQAKHPASH